MSCKAATAATPTSSSTAEIATAESRSSTLTVAPLLRDKNGECFAMNCRVPIFRLSPNQIEDEVASRLKSLAANVRRQLAFVIP